MMTTEKLQRAYTYQDFLPERGLWQKIQTLYTKNEGTFDPLRIHGWTHAYRSCYAAHHLHKAFLEYYQISYPEKIWMVVIALHDVGRQDNGTDLWEENSAAICYEFLSSELNIQPLEATRLAECIISSKPAELHALQKLLKDADALEYSRLIAKGEFDYRRLTIADELDNINISKIDNILNDLKSLQEVEIMACIVDS